MVLLQLVVAAVQYVSLAVAQKAPAGADLVDGTTSHNFWPVFALPASLVLVLSSKDRTRFLWPVAVTLLAVYAEAKAALIVWLPLLVIIGTAYAVSCTRANRADRADRVSPLRSAEDPVARAGLVLVTFAVILVGLWWTPSVQGTWGVFVGHSRALEEFAVNGQGADDGAPTLKQAATAVRESLTADPIAALFGRGPANTTSHAAEILAQGAKNGVSLPPPGPLATELLTGGDAFKFRDAQSSVLGVLGDLGVVGLVLYLTVCALATWVLFRTTESVATFHSPRAWTVPWIVAGVLAGGTLLDWPEQASVVLPLMLAVLVLRAPAGGGPDSHRAADGSTAIATGPPATRTDSAGHPGVAAV
jgi:hypothetical protein